MRREALRELWMGLTRPSPLALAITLTTPAIGFALLTMLIRPEVLASESHRYFACHPGDSDLFLGARLAAIEQARPDEPVVVLLGSSAMRESLSGSEDISRLIERSHHLEVEVWDLAALGQTLEASLAVAERVPENLSGVFVVGVTPFSLALGPSARAGLWKRVVEGDAPLEIPLRERGAGYFWANREFFVPRLPCLARNLWSGPVTAGGHLFVEEHEPMPEESWLTLKRRLVERITASEAAARIEESLETLARIGEEAGRRGDVRLVVLESPISRRVVREVLGTERWRAHQIMLTEFARRHDLEYWDLHRQARLGGGDFYDGIHLYRTDAMLRHTSVLAREIGELLTRGSDGRDDRE